MLLGCRKLLSAIVFLAPFAVGCANVASASVMFRHLTTEAGGKILMLDGEFEPSDDPSKIASELTATPARYIVLNSLGGDRATAMSFGRAIRKSGLPTLLVRNSTCLNTCLLAFFGGTQRYAEDASVHLTSTSFLFPAEQQGGSQPAAATPIKEYLMEMGVSTALLDASTSLANGQTDDLNLVRLAGLGVVTGQPSGGSPDAPEGYELAEEADAIETFNTFERIWSGPKVDAIAFLRAIYADRVSYYGKDTAKDDVVTEKDTFADRWPIRIYLVRDGTAHASCKDQCSVFGIVDWFAYSAERKKSASGAVNFALTWDPVNRKVLTETGRIVETDKGAGIPDRMIRRWLIATSVCSAKGAASGDGAEACRSQNVIEAGLRSAGWCNAPGLGWRQCVAP